MLMKKWPQARLRDYALWLLARREYSEQQLRLKLQQRAENPEDVLIILAQLQAKGWQSDQRCGEQWLRHCLQKGYGRLKVQAVLRQKGLSSAQISALLAEVEIDWFSQAVATYNKQFFTAITDADERQKRYRFLQQRGFRHDEICEALAVQIDQQP